MSRIGLGCTVVAAAAAFTVAGLLAYFKKRTSGKDQGKNSKFSEPLTATEEKQEEDEEKVVRQVGLCKSAKVSSLLKPEEDKDDATLDNADKRRRRTKRLRQPMVKDESDTEEEEEEDADFEDESDESDLGSEMSDEVLSDDGIKTVRVSQEVMTPVKMVESTSKSDAVDGNDIDAKNEIVWLSKDIDDGGKKRTQSVGNELEETELKAKTEGEIFLLNVGRCQNLLNEIVPEEDEGQMSAESSRESSEVGEEAANEEYLFIRPDEKQKPADDISNKEALWQTVSNDPFEEFPRQIANPTVELTLNDDLACWDVEKAISEYLAEDSFAVYPQYSEQLSQESNTSPGTVDDSCQKPPPPPLTSSSTAASDETATNSLPSFEMVSGGFGRDYLEGTNGGGGEAASSSSALKRWNEGDDDSGRAEGEIKNPKYLEKSSCSPVTSAINDEVTSATMNSHIEGEIEDTKILEKQTLLRKSLAKTEVLTEEAGRIETTTAGSIVNDLKFPLSASLFDQFEHDDDVAAKRESLKAKEEEEEQSEIKTMS